MNGCVGKTEYLKKTGGGRKSAAGCGCGMGAK
jgi:hypothetical protein